jgi:hypothetical protein
MENTSSTGIRNGWSTGRSAAGCTRPPSHQLEHRVLADLRVDAVGRRLGRALGDRDVVARELVGAEELAHLHLDQLKQLLVVHQVDLVHVHHQRRHPDLTRQQDVLARLRHRAVGRRHHQDGAVHLRRARDHVLDVVGVARAVDVGVVTVGRLVLHVRGVDRDPARLLLRRRIDVRIRLRRRPAGLGQRHGDRRRQRRLPMIHVTNRADVAMRLAAVELFLGHRL